MLCKWVHSARKEAAISCKFVPNVDASCSIPSRDMSCRCCSEMSEQLALENLRLIVGADESHLGLETTFLLTYCHEKINERI